MESTQSSRSFSRCSGNSNVSMDRPELPDADLIIRPGGEMRLSNFLLWESAYAELVFSPILWPDYTARDFAENIAEYQKRERRFGGVK